MYYLDNKDEMKYKKRNIEGIKQNEFRNEAIMSPSVVTEGKRALRKMLQNKMEKLKEVGVEFDKEGNVSEELLKKDKIIYAIYDFFCTEKFCLFNPS